MTVCEADYVSRTSGIFNGGFLAKKVTFVQNINYFFFIALPLNDFSLPTFNEIKLVRFGSLPKYYITLFVKGKVQGASTITQQLAKNLFFSFEQSWHRKFKELLVALQIESSFTKEQILEAYVNQIHFGAGAQGVEKAAQTFFGKSASDLNLAESALLAGLPKSPTRYNPYRHFDLAKSRQRIVLQRMVVVNAISAREAESASQEKLTLRPRGSGARTGSYFLDAVIKSLEEKYGPEVVYHGGLKVTTTLDPQMQSWAVVSVKNGLSALDNIMGFDAEDLPDQNQATRLWHRRRLCRAIGSDLCQKDRLDLSPQFRVAGLGQRVVPDHRGRHGEPSWRRRGRSGPGGAAGTAARVCPVPPADIRRVVDRHDALPPRGFLAV